MPWSWPWPCSGSKPIAQIAKDLSISESCLRRWMDVADVEEGHKEGLSRDERAELVRLRRETRVQAMEIEILKRASACFARENVLPNRVPGGPRTRPPWPQAGVRLPDPTRHLSVKQSHPHCSSGGLGSNACHPK